MKIVYFTSTGNTEIMANAIARGIERAGKTAELITVDAADASMLESESAFALGCPAMGVENLEESYMEPLVAELEGKVTGKTILLFGSYGWGDGQWMRDWVARMEASGAKVLGGENAIANYAPTDEASLEVLGETLANV